MTPHMAEIINYQGVEGTKIGTNAHGTRYRLLVIDTRNGSIRNQAFHFVIPGSD